MFQIVIWFQRQAPDLALHRPPGQTLHARNMASRPRCRRARRCRGQSAFRARCRLAALECRMIGHRKKERSIGSGTTRSRSIARALCDSYDKMTTAPCDLAINRDRAAHCARGRPPLMANAGLPGDADEAFVA